MPCLRAVSMIVSSARPTTVRPFSLNSTGSAATSSLVIAVISDPSL